MDNARPRLKVAGTTCLAGRIAAPRLERRLLASALERHRGRDPRIAERLHHLKHQYGGIEDSGARGLDRALGTLLDGVALRGSLRACPEALRLEDVLDTRGLVLFQLDAAEYPHATRKIAAWVLLGMARVARATVERSNGVAIATPWALLLVDEVGALGSSARHLRGLVGRARESGLEVVLATQPCRILRLSIEPWYTRRSKTRRLRWLSDRADHTTHSLLRRYSARPGRRT